MKAKELIKRLEQFDPEMQVCILDWRKNIYNATGDPDDYSNGIGIHPIEVVDRETDAEPVFISLYYDNDDYTKEGDPDYGSNMVSRVSEGEKNEA